MTRSTPFPNRSPAARARALAALLSLLAGAALAADPAPSAGRKLAERHGCLGCHAVNAQLVGPAYEAVAQRYADQKGCRC